MNPVQNNGAFGRNVVSAKVYYTEWHIKDKICLLIYIELVMAPFYMFVLHH